MSLLLLDTVDSPPSPNGATKRSPSPIDTEHGGQAKRNRSDSSVKLLEDMPMDEPDDKNPAVTTGKDTTADCVEENDNSLADGDHSDGEAADEVQSKPTTSHQQDQSSPRSLTPELKIV